MKSTQPMPQTEEEWKQRLTPEQYRILRQKGTEAPFTGEYVHSQEKGIFACAACGNQLFSSEAKFDSNTGWPSFDQALPGSVAYHEDDSHGMRRVEVTCAQCGGHLGHVFEDGPTATTGKRFCVNSACLMMKKIRAMKNKASTGLSSLRSCGYYGGVGRPRYSAKADKILINF